MNYYQLEPFGGEPLDTQMGILISMVASAMRSRGTRAFRGQDFMMWDRTSQRDPATMESEMTAWARAHNERVKANRGKGR